MKISEIITDKYKLRIPPTVFYDLLADVVEAEEDQEPTTKNDNTVLEDIKAEIEGLKHIKEQGTWRSACNEAIGIIDEHIATTKNDLAVEKTDMIDKSNFSQEQYKTDLQSAYDCGYAQAKNDLGVDAVSRQAINGYIDYILSHGMGKKKSFDFIKKFVANLPPTTPQEPRWIPVSERLPKDNDYHTCIENVDGAVIWCTDKGIIGLGWYYESTQKWGGLDDIFPEKWGEVIAWMPLPEPYMMESENSK